VSDAKAPLYKQQETRDDWSTMLYNQERMISNQDQMLEVTRKLLENQQRMGMLADKLEGHLNELGDVMTSSTAVTRGLVDKIVQVPITIVMIAAASGLFYLKYIEEWTWLVICAVAAFKYLGDSITAVVKLFGLGRGSGNGPARGQTGDAK